MPYRRFCTFQKFEVVKYFRKSGIILSFSPLPSPASCSLVCLERGARARRPLLLVSALAFPERVADFMSPRLVREEAGVTRGEI